MIQFLKRVRASFYFHFFKRFISYRPSGGGVFITFDDGPEPEITEFILEELAKYNAKATFFCCGYNMKKNKYLLDRIVSEGHVVANHTYSHLNGLSTPVGEYVNDVLKVDTILPTKLFRPPWGQLNMREYMKLTSKKVVLWDVESGDVTEKYNKEKLIEYWNNNVRDGKIILFHFSEEHAVRTKDLLPDFLRIFSEKGFTFDIIK